MDRALVAPTLRRVPPLQGGVFTVCNAIVLTVLESLSVSVDLLKRWFACEPLSSSDSPPYTVFILLYLLPMYSFGLKLQ